ncbi:MAG: transketolase [Chloroflexota bacterium]
MTPASDQLDRLCVNTIRTLAIDGVQQANSGHPGAPMGMAPMAYALWTRHLRHAPTIPTWPNRDRFVLSAGHASMLLYSLLHLAGYEVSLDDLKSFRQWGSRTPGHPEYGWTKGVEATTGPLGQGFVNAVGMAIAERRLAGEFNKPGHDVIDHRTFTICSDGDLQEGITAEAASLAGHLQLGKLVALYDSNGIQLDGPTAWTFTEDVLARFAAYGWHTQRVEDGNDVEAIDAAITAAKADPRPSLILVRTHIGFGSPNKQDSQKSHGAPLGPDEVRLTKEAYGWDPDQTFFVPDEALAVFRRSVREGEAAEAAWNAALDAYASAFPAEGAELRRRIAGDLPDGWDAALNAYPTGSEVATRNASQDLIQTLGAALPELFGGSADLSESNLTDIKALGHDHFAPDHAGRNIRFGVREHTMGAIANGIAYHGGFIPYTATFMTFSDYMRGSVRVAALSGLHEVYVWTHDSIGVGEDGPTHQPVEHYAALRAIPNLWFLRPGDANEAAAAWALAVERPHVAGASSGPVALSLTRQKLPTLPGTDTLAREGVRRGGYVLREAVGGTPALIMVGTGSELSLCFAAAEALEAEGIPTRVVSLPSWERFEAQDQAYRESVLPPSVRKRVTVEAGISLGWERYAGDEGAILGVDRYGASAPAPKIFEAFGLTVANVTDIGRRVVRDGLHGRQGVTLGHGH